MKNGLNFILFQSLWISCILGAANHVIWPAVLIISSMLGVFLFPAFRHKKDILFLSVCIIMGFILDSLLAYLQLIDYNYDYGLNQTAPFWILFLWAGFALTLNHSMSWLLKKPKLGTLFILIGAPLSYYSAEKLMAIKINETIITLCLISVLWLLVYHIILAINGLFFRSTELNHV